MPPETYTEEQKKEILERLARASASLKELEFELACQPTMENTGNNVFGIKLTPYLQDTKYSSKESPIQP